VLLELRKRRLAAGLTQRELAQRARTSPSVLSRIERGRLYAYPALRRRIAAALNCNEHEIFPELPQIGYSPRP